MRPPSVVFKLALILVTIPVLHCQGFNKQVIYQVVADRFLDCNAANADSNERLSLWDPTHKNWHGYWGRDLAGIEKQLSISAAWVLR